MATRRKHLATVAVERCDSHQGGNLAPAKSAELGQMGEQSSDRDTTYCRHAPKQFCFLAPNGERWIACSRAAAAGPELIGRLDKEFTGRPTKVHLPASCTPR